MTILDRMSSNKSIKIPKEYLTVTIITVALVIILTGGTIWAYVYASKRPSTIVLPGGVTYLGPSQSSEQIEPQQDPNKINLLPNAQWQEQRGKLFPYSFSYPNNMSLGVFPNDPFDAVTIFWGNTNPQENIFLRIENLNQLKGMKSYITKPKLEYARDWWKQYNWKGVANVSEFTNSKGLKGYRAKYLDASNQTPYDHVFFEVPNRSDLVIWMSGRLLTQPLFDKIVDSVSWNPQVKAQ